MGKLSVSGRPRDGVPEAEDVSRADDTEREGLWWWLKAWSWERSWLKGPGGHGLDAMSGSDTLFLVGGRDGCVSNPILSYPVQCYPISNLISSQSRHGPDSRADIEGGREMCCQEGRGTTSNKQASNQRRVGRPGGEEELGELIGWYVV
jgi:hypothetical protein